MQRSESIDVLRLFVTMVIILGWCYRRMSIRFAGRVLGWIIQATERHPKFLYGKELDAYGCDT